MSIFSNPDGSETAVFGRYQHYREGNTWRDVDLNFRPVGRDYVMDRHDVAVRVTPDGVQATERASGKGVFWATPAPADVSGRRASFAGPLGLTWSYYTRVSGIKLLAPVSEPLGPRTLSFTYRLLGGAAPIAVQEGALVSDVFSVPAPVALGADDVEYPIGVWRLGPGADQVSFDLDESALPATAYPYQLDPTTQFYVTASSYDGTVRGLGTSYPPACDYVYPDSNTRQNAERSYYAGDYTIKNGIMRWATNALPYDAILLGTTLTLRVTDNYTGSNRKLTADWYNAGSAITCTDYSASALTTAAASMDFPTGTGYRTFSLDNSDGVSLSSFTGLRLHVSGSAPGARNYLHWASFDDTVYDGARLDVTYNRPPTTPVLSAPSDGAVVTTDQPTFTVSATDPDGDALNYYFHLSTSPDGFDSAVDSGWTGTIPWKPPYGSLEDGRTYYWQVQARDSVKDPGSSYSDWSATRSFRVDLGLGERPANAYDRLGPLAVNLANGNLTAGISSPSVSSLGGPIGVSYSYNSRRPSSRGLMASYFNDLDHDHVFDANEAPSVSRRDYATFNWGTAYPYRSVGTDYFLARWSGYVTVPAAGDYQFGTLADDGTRVWVDNQLVFDHWVNQTAPTAPQYGTALTLAAGQSVPIKIEYYENTGPARMELWANGPCGDGGAVQDCQVPSSWLTTDTPGLPDGWAMSTDPDGGLFYSSAKIFEQQVLLSDSTGATHIYTSTPTGWVPPAGEDGVLATDASTGLLVFQSEDGSAFSFNADGSLAKMVAPADDRKPAALTYTWTQGSQTEPLRLTQITDPVSTRSVVLTYGGGSCPSAAGFDAAPSYMLCKIDYSAFGIGESDLYYLNGHLARIVDPGGATTDFGYDANGRIIAIRDALTNDLIAAGAFTDSDAHKTLVTYDVNAKVSSITAPESSAGAARAQRTYDYTAPTAPVVHVAGITEPLGYSRKVTLDSSGRMTEDRDLAGKVTTYVYDSADRVVKTTDPAGLVTTTIYDVEGRPTDSYGPGAAGEFDANNRSATAPHSQTFYDEGITGLGAAWWDNQTLSSTPKVHTTLSAWPNWGSGSPATGIPADGFSGRITGEITAATAGSYAFSADVDTDDGVKLLIDDQQVLGRWGGTGTLTGSTTLTQGVHRIRLDYQDQTGSARLILSWTPPGSGAVQVPMSALAPRYGLATTTVDPDGKKTRTEYPNPELGLATASVIDPDGLALRSTTTFETLGVGYLRRTARTLPKGASTQVSYTYYGDTETATNPCPGGGSGISQAGALKTTTAADPDAAGPKTPIVREYRYDAAGRQVASRVVGDTYWSCTTYDARGRVTSSIDSANKTTSIDYSNPLQVTATFPNSAGTTRTTVSKNDWTGKSISYTDEHATVTRTIYDQAGRPTETWRQFSGQSNAKLTQLAYSTSTGRLDSITEYASGTGRTTSFTYDDAGRLLATTRPNGVVTTNAYDSSRGWLNTITNKKNSTELSPWTYTRNASGDIASEATTGRTRAFTYDGAGRLTRTVQGAATRNYSYDANTNRCSTSTTCDGSYTYDNADRLTASPFASAYTYDTHGNLTQATPSTQPPAGNFSQAVTFDAFASTASQSFPITVGQAGSVSAQYAWTSSTPVGRSGTPTGSIAASGSASTPLIVDGESYVASSLSWTKGQHQVSSSFSSSVTAGGTKSHTFAPDASGTVSASVDWSGSSTSGTWPGTVAALGVSERTITASASGNLTASLSWPSAIPNPDLDLYLLDASTRAVLASSLALTGNSESLSYTVPGSVGYSAPKDYILQVKAKTTGSTFTLSSTWPVTADVDLEIWRGTTLVASSYSTTAKPESVSATGQPAGTYTLKILSKDFYAGYNATANYQQLTYADLSFALKDPGGTAVRSVRGSAGSLSFTYLAASGGAYTLAITNNSSDIAVPTYSMPWSTTTLTDDSATGSIAASGTATKPFTADGSGYSSASLTWTKGQHQVSSSFPSSVGAGGTNTHTVSPDASGTVSATLDWNASTTSGSWASSVGTLGVYERTITASGAGNLHAGVTWPSAIPNPDLDLYLLDASTRAVLRSSEALTGNSESFDYTVPSITYPATRDYILQVKAKATGSTFTLSSTWPVTANLDLELWRGSTLVASSYSTTAKPEAVSAASEPAGTYTVKVISTNYSASYTAAASYQQQAYANLTLRLKDPGGSTITSTSGSAGSLALTTTLAAQGNYTAEIQNGSADLAVPTYNLALTYPKSHAATAKLELKNPSGGVVATDQGTSALAFSPSVSSAGTYTLVVTPLTGVGSGTLTAGYPGRPAKEVITYDGNDHATSIDDGTNTTTEVLSPSGRVLRRTVTDDATGQVSEDVIFGYDSGSDSPAYSRPVAGGATTTYITGPDGLLVIDTAGTATYPIQNGHGDVVGTTDSAGAFTANPEADEFGVGAPPTNRLGWLGGKQRFSTGGNLALVRMGVRLYDPALGRFLEVDSVEGGSANDYDYVDQDPVNDFDLAGTFGWKKMFRRIGRGVSAVGGAAWRNRNTILGVAALVAYASCPFTAGAGCAVGQGLSIAAAADSGVSMFANCTTRGGRSRSCRDSAVSTMLNFAAVAGPATRSSRVLRAKHLLAMTRWMRVAGTNIRWGGLMLGMRWAA